jgi:predicted GNAT family N-acyltransferase
VDARHYGYGEFSVMAPKIVIASTPQQRNDAFAVRIAVFVEEQGIDRSEELDDFDASATHCVTYVDGTPAAAGRLLLFEGYAKIGRMAVLASYRGAGLGALVLDSLEREGIARGIRHFKLSAQLHARGFYERRGYAAHGDLYDDVGIPHIDMEKIV